MTGTRYEQSVLDLARDLWYLRSHTYDITARPWNALSGQERQEYISIAQGVVERMRPAYNNACEWKRTA